MPSSGSTTSTGGSTPPAPVPSGGPPVVNYPEGNVPDVGPDLVIPIGDTFKAFFQNILWLDPTRTKLWFTLKAWLYDADSAALFQVTEQNGALVVAGAPATVSTLGSLIVISEGVPGNHGAEVHLLMHVAATTLFCPTVGASYSIKEERGEGREHTLLQGKATIAEYATLAT